MAPDFRRPPKCPGLILIDEPTKPDSNTQKGGAESHPLDGSSFLENQLGPRCGSLGNFRVPGAGHAAFLGSADHVFAFIVAPFAGGHLVGQLDAIAVWVADVYADGVAVVRHALDLYVLLLDPEVEFLLNGVEVVLGVAERGTSMSIYHIALRIEVRNIEFTW